MAAPKKIQTLNLNLLIRQDKKSQLYTNLISWLLSSGKYILIVVELVVIAAFIARYKMDTDLASLREEINTQVSYLKSLQNDEILIRRTQFQLDTIKKTKQEKPDFHLALTTLAKLTPTTIRLTAINFDGTKAYPTYIMTVSGEASSPLEISAFKKALEGESLFKSIELLTVSKEQGGLTFTITSTLNR